MPWYAYKAVDKQGKSVKGEAESESEIALTTELAKKGLLPVNIAYKEAARPVSPQAQGGAFM